jgi:hypothetical protein
MNRLLRHTTLAAILGLTGAGFGTAAEKKAPVQAAPQATLAHQPFQPAPATSSTTITTRDHVTTPARSVTPDDLRFRGNLKERVQDMSGHETRGKSDQWAGLTGRAVPKGAFVGDDKAKDKGPPAGFAKFVNGSKYGDTFFGERFNSRSENPNGPDLGHGSHGRNPFMGSGQEQLGARKGGNKEGSHSKTGKEKKGPDDRPTDTTAIDKDLERQAGEAAVSAEVERVAKGVTGEGSGSNLPDGWRYIIGVREGTKLPTDDRTGGSGGIVRDRTKTPAKQLAGIVKPINLADGRVRDGSTGVGRWDRMAVRQAIIGGQEAKAERSSGTISMEQALKGNNVTNPGQK